MVLNGLQRQIKVLNKRIFGSFKVRDTDFWLMSLFDFDIVA